METIGTLPFAGSLRIRGVHAQLTTLLESRQPEPRREVEASGWLIRAEVAPDGVEWEQPKQ